MTATASYSNLQGTVQAPVGTASITLSERFPWLVPSIQSSPQLEVSVTDASVVEDDDLAAEFAAYADVSSEWAATTWEATSEAWPEY